VDLFKKNMKGWSDKKIILYLFCSSDLLRKKVENNFFIRAALLCANIPQIFFLNSIIKNICTVYLRVCSTGPFTFFTSFSKPAGASTDSCDKSSAASLNDQLDPNICWKVKLSKYCFKIFNLKQFRSLKMGGEVVILANSLISYFQ
jgi:hypothetical protein